jgi:hypothetical protein
VSNGLSRFEARDGTLLSQRVYTIANFKIHLGGHRVFVLNKRGILLEQSGKRPSFDTPIKHK